MQLSMTRQEKGDLLNQVAI